MSAGGESKQGREAPAASADDPGPGLPPRPSDVSAVPRSSAASVSTTASSAVSKRDRIVQELLSTETSYVGSLQTLVDCFMKPLTLGTGCGTSDQLLTPSESRSIFANVDHLCRLNSSLLHSLEREMLQHGPSQARVGKILFEFAPFFRVYMSYIDAFSQQTRRLEEICAEKKGLVEQLQKCTADPRCKGLELRSFLIMPVQRIPRYKMLLAELDSRTDDDHPDAADVARAKDKIANVAMQINTSIKQQENRQVMLDLRAAVLSSGQGGMDLWRTAWPGEDLLESHRSLIKVGRLVKRSRAKKSNKSRCIFVLLNDTLMYGDVAREKIMSSVLRMSVGRDSPAAGARPASMRRATVQIPPSIVLRAVIPLWTQGNRCHVNRRQGECAIEFISDQKSFDIVADTERMADEWSSDIADAISACSARLLLMETRKKWTELREAIIAGDRQVVDVGVASTMVTAKMEDCDAMFELAVQRMLADVASRQRLAIVKLLIDRTLLSIRALDAQFQALMNVVSEEGDTVRAGAALEVANLLMLKVSAGARDSAIATAAGPGRFTAVVALVKHTSMAARIGAFRSAAGALMLRPDLDDPIEDAAPEESTAAVAASDEEAKAPPLPARTAGRRASLTYHAKAVSAFDLSASAESLDVIRELAPVMTEEVRRTVLTSAACEGCVALCTALVMRVTEDTRHHVLLALRHRPTRAKNAAAASAQDKAFERVVRIFGTIDKKAEGNTAGSTGRNSFAVRSVSITEKAAQQKAATLTPMARQLLGAWDIREGLLCKRGAIVRSWKTRIFSLNSAALTYHKPIKIDGQLSKELGSIDLSVPGTRVVVPDAGAIKKNKLRTPCFALCTPDRTYFMQANSDEDRDAWMAAIRTNIEIANADAL